MIPPTGGRETEPELDQSAEPDGQQTDYAPAAATSYSPRVKIFFFGVVGGWLVAIAYSVIHTVLLLIATGSSLESPFAQFGQSGGSSRTLFPTFVAVLLAATPWFIVAATMAAAADAVIRRSHRDARATRDALRSATRGSDAAPAAPPVPPVSDRRASDIVEPFRRERDMEVDTAPDKDQ